MSELNVIKNNPNLTTIQKITLLMPRLPIHVQADISKRVLDWIASGGSLEADYVESQLEYGLRVLDRDNRHTERVFIDEVRRE